MSTDPVMLAIAEFQSLLYWIRPSDAKPATAPLLRAECFNPCCIGLGLQTRNPQPLRCFVQSVSILVVLD